MIKTSPAAHWCKHRLPTKKKNQTGVRLSPTLCIKKQWSNNFKVLKKDYLELKILYVAKLAFKV